MTQYDATTKELIRKARGKFIAMAGTYCLGTFNDNFYKQAMMLLAITVGKQEYQGYAAVVFTLPFVIFAAPAGWMADRFSKRHVVIASKVLELVAMLFGAAGVILLNWPLAFVMLAIMGTQATIFSPSINGSIPELYPESYVTKANGFVKMFSIAAILGGIASAGIVLGIKGDTGWGYPANRIAVGFGVVAAAFLGVLVSLGVPSRPAAAPGRRFPWSGPWDTLKTVRAIGRDRELSTAIWANAYFWFVGLVEVQVINYLGKVQYALGDARTSYMLAAQLSGIAVGGLMSARLAAGGRWQRPIVATSTIMSGLMFALAAVPFLTPAAQVPALHVLLGLIGMTGGIVIVPMESFIQVRPARDKKGAVISAANFAAFSAMLVSGPVANLLNAKVLPTTSFGVMGVMTLAVAAILWFVLRSRRDD